MSDTQPYHSVRTNIKPRAVEIDIMFDRTITKPSEWHEEIYMIRQARKKEDLVNFHVNSYGGWIDTLSLIHHEVSINPAHFHGILEGQAASAGSAIFLMCHTHEVADLATMMIHTAQGGAGGAANQVLDGAKNLDKQAKLFMHEFYKDFLTEEEIDRCLDGKEYYFEAEEIRTRLKKREEIRANRQKEEDNKDFTIQSYAKECIPDVMADVAYYNMEFDELITALTVEYARNTLDGDEFREFEKTLKEEVNAISEEEVQEEKGREEEQKEDQEVVDTAPKAATIELLSESGDTLREVELKVQGDYGFVELPFIYQGSNSTLVIKKSVIEDEEGQIEDFGSEEFVNAFETQDLHFDYLKVIANVLGITFGNKIKAGTLAGRINWTVKNLQRRL